MKLLKRLSAVAACLIALPFTVGMLGGFTIVGQADIRHSGKGSLTLTVESALPESEFVETAAAFVREYNIIGGDPTLLELARISKTDGGYDVRIDFRRIDKIKGMGDFALATLAEYTEEESQTVTQLRKWDRGSYDCTMPIVLDGQSCQVRIARDTDTDYKAGLRTASGEPTDLEEFIAAGQKADDKRKLLSVRLLGLEGVTSITATVPGTIEYVAGDSITLVDEHTIRLVPAKIPATVSRTVTVSDGSGSETTEIQITEEMLDTVIGYIVFRQSISPVAVGFISAGTAVGVGLLIWLCVALYRAGRKSAERKKLAAEGSRLALLAVSSDDKTGSVNDVGTHPETAASPADEPAAVPETAAAKAGSASVPKPDSPRRLVRPGVFGTMREGLVTAARSKRWRDIKRHKYLYLMVVPLLVLIIIFQYCSCFGIVIAFQDYKLTEGVGGSEWVGWQHFKSVFGGTLTGTYVAFRNTIFISLIRIGTNFPVILIFTLLVNEIKSRKVKTVVQTISYIPYFISWVAVGGMAYNLLAADGIINKIIVAFGGESVLWYSAADKWWGILALSSLWKGMGWATLIYISALGSINEELYDACTIDGGGRFRKMISVTLPGLMSVIILQIIMDIGHVMGDNYPQILAMRNGSNTLSSTTRVIGEITYGAIQDGSGQGRATAIGLVQSVLGLILMLTANWIARKTDNEGII